MGIYMGGKLVQALWLDEPVLAAYYGSELVWPDETEEPEGPEWLWQTDGTSVTLLLYLGKAHSLVIPSEIEGLPVTALAPTACNYCNAISVTIPESVTLLQ